MATIQIRDIPEDTYETIRRRARAEGKSLQSFMREQVIDFAAQRTKAEVLAAVEAALANDIAPGANPESIVGHLVAERR
jgi:plasmid stability protein